MRNRSRDIEFYKAELLIRTPCKYLKKITQQIKFRRVLKTVHCRPMCQWSFFLDNTLSLSRGYKELMTLKRHPVNRVHVDVYRSKVQIRKLHKQNIRQYSCIRRISTLLILHRERRVKVIIAEK